MYCQDKNTDIYLYCRSYLRHGSPISQRNPAHFRISVYPEPTPRNNTISSSCIHPHLEVSQSNEISQAARAISGPQLPEGKWRPVLWSPSILGGAISSSSGRLTADVAARRFRGINLSAWSFKPVCAAHQALSSSVPQEASLLERGSKLWTIKSLWLNRTHSFYLPSHCVTWEKATGPQNSPICRQVGRQSGAKHTVGFKPCYISTLQSDDKVSP